MNLGQDSIHQLAHVWLHSNRVSMMVFCICWYQCYLDLFYTIILENSESFHFPSTQLFWQITRVPFRKELGKLLLKINTKPQFMSVMTLAVLLQWTLSLFSSVISSDSQYHHISGNWTKNSVFKKWRQIATYRCVLGPLGKMAESKM